MKAGNKTQALMIQGTCSGAGKSMLVTGLARLFADQGVRVAPFKSQNMALNSFITREGAEIGRAQALQAQAARVEPTSDMNPVLLKAAGDNGCQVIVNGKVHSNMKAREYHVFQKEAWRYVQAAYKRLSNAYDLILIEGAGSPAEINLMQDEIANMRVARHTGSPVLLVGDIDRGGVFASLYGTVRLLESDAHLIKGFVINKFRGDKDILAPGLRMMHEKTGIATVGVVPYMENPGLEEEDSLSLGGNTSTWEANRLRVVVVKIPYISNFTDFDALSYEPDVEVIFSSNATEIENADLVIVPGSKNTVESLLVLKESGLDRAVINAASRGIQVIGICGGYQLLGQRILDPMGVEGGHPVVAGLGLLDIETEFESNKVTSQTEARTSLHGFEGTVKGYETHMGFSRGDIGLFSFKRIATGESLMDGSIKNNVWGTYLHGVFDSDGFRKAILDEIRANKGYPVVPELISYEETKDANIDRWAGFLAGHLDMKTIEGWL